MDHQTVRTIFTHKQNRMEIPMSQKTNLKPLAIAAGAALATSLAATTPASAAENPFAMSELSSGYMVAEMAEGKCGGNKAAGETKTMEEGKCGEGKCGGTKATEETKTMKEGKCGGTKATEETKTMKEGKCGEGKCGANK
jgi:uncharacterized low-complexity protein